MAWGSGSIVQGQTERAVGDRGVGDIGIWNDWRAYESDSVHLHCLLRELARRGEQVSRYLDRVFERHGVVRRHAAHEPVADAQLPDHRPEPVLRDPQIYRLRFCAFQVRG
jgi:hypothetical protein